jgi:chemotaxis protein MotB
MTYADLITLLLIFFIILYTMSKVDADKYQSLSDALRLEFRDGHTIIPLGTGIQGSVDPGIGKETEANPDKSDHKEKDLQDLLRVVQQYIADNNLNGRVAASDTKRGIAITLNDLFLFDLGKADLKPEAYPVLEKLASLFPKLNAKISIEGHTDNLPLATGSFYQDNWGLSQARSVSVIRYFVNTAKLDPKQFVSAAYADTRPVAPNDTEANRQKNRRVEIIVLRGDE